ncbi:tRNA (guanine-N(7)-)-methyltransferase non-catalytic subunit WDR4-like [Papaver somniferum]|uniref:tRNA (guanine-N(7)-)-methyltransferase non-catalytic subunit WDR4-like n=1 Tax=Papaver somniferum TaxID=3469 RepID=UPI000E702B4C|nr:tRNA (guanine-N(7)-)-methyltransferase non-catalytic subunit WDR4-like [Papaver somniferum]
MEEETLMDVGVGINKETEVAPALISVHPLEKSVAVAIGSQLRVYDLQGDCCINLVDDSGGNQHTGSIREICYGAKGSLFASAGDDKLVKIWSTDSWHCIRTVCSEKRVTAVAISHDGFFVTFADKFGVVWVVGLDGICNETNNKPASLFGHYCSIITSLEFSPDGRFIISADRDFKIRVTVFPEKPLSGAHEIQSFCLGHTEFVSCVAVVASPEVPEGFLLSGSGDCTVRLWDITSGALLDTCDVSAQAGVREPSEKEDAFSSAVTDICAYPNGSIVAVAVQGLQGVLLLSCDLFARTLSVIKVVSVGETFIPTSLGLNSSAEHLWMITGASNLPALDDPSFARVRVVSGIHKESKGSTWSDPIVLEDSKIPGGEKLLEKLQGSVSIAKEEQTLAAAAEAVKMAMRNLLIKREYSSEKRELRKKSRNDKKLKQ